MGALMYNKLRLIDMTKCSEYKCEKTAQKECQECDSSYCPNHAEEGHHECM